MACKACLEGYSTSYKRLPNFLRELDASRETGTYDKLMGTFGKTDLNYYPTSISGTSSFQGT